MKTVEEGIRFIKANHKPNDEISYDELENFLGILGVPFIERQRMRIDYAKRLNTALRKGQVFDEHSDVVYTSLWVNERGKSFVLIPLSQVLLKDSQRTYTSIAQRLDDVLYEYARALGMESYKSKVTDKISKFKGIRPLLSVDEFKILERHFDTMQIVAPMIESADRAATSANKALAELIGPRVKQLSHDNSGKFLEAA